MQILQSIRSTGRRLRGAGRTISPVVLALLLVTGGVGMSPAGPAVGTASAEWVACSLADPLLGAAYNTIIGADSGCRWSAGTKTDVENLTATDAYANSLAMKDSAGSYTTAVGNYQQNGRSVAYSKAKIVMVNELNNGTSPSVIKQRVNETIRDYYTRQQMEVVADWNAKATQLEYLSNTSATFYGDDTQQAQGAGLTDFAGTGFPLVNGTSVNISAVGYANTDGSGDEYLWPASFTDAGQKNYGPYIYGSRTDSVILSEDPSDSSTTVVLNETWYQTLMETAENQSVQVQDNMAPYVDEVANQYAAGEINSTDLATYDPAVIGQEASTSFNSTGYYGHAAIMLASIGAGGDINASHNLTVGSTTLDGTLFYTGGDAPSGGWVTDQSYNLTDYDGTFYMAVQKDDGSGTIVDLEDYGSSFTINEATNTKTGESLNATQVETYTYDSVNASELGAEIDRLKALRTEYEGQVAAGGGGGLFGGSGVGIGVIVGAALVAALVLRD